MTDDKCRHCRKNKIVRPRGLCWRCYYTLGVKDLYGTANPKNAKYANRGVGLGVGLAADRGVVEPCPHPAGSEGKIAALAERAAAGLPLFHPADSLALADRPGREGYHREAS